MNKVGDLRVWWVPQVPMQPFHFPVPDLRSGVMLMDALAKYDAFQFEHNVKPDYCNAGGIEQWSADHDGEGNPGWESWYDDESGEDDPKVFLQEQS